MTSFLALGDVANVVVRAEAFPYVRDSEESWNGRTPNGLQGRIVFADAIGLCLNSHDGRCMPLFDEDSSKIELAELQAGRGTFFPWHSVVSLVKISDAERYEVAWQQHERDLDAFYNVHDSYPGTSHEFYQWRNSLSQTAYDAAYNAGN